MIRIFDCEQGSAEWFQCRLGIPTASEFKSIMAKGEGKTRRTYLMKLLGERLTGEPMDNYTNGHMERGRVMEAEARNMYAFVHDAEPKQVGFVRNDDVGCSPDSLLGESGVLEIKTKLAHLQIEAILGDKLPPEHAAQVLGQLWVTEREWCDFVSYWPKLPLFVKRVHRDEAKIKAIEEEVGRFLDEMNETLLTITAKAQKEAA